MIEAALVQAVIEQESAGNPKAVSAAGAKGLMQLMDATGREWHENLGLADPYDPFNPDQNERIGASYLAWLLTQFDHDVEFALAAYNAGIGYIQKKIKQINAEKFSDIEPFIHAETRHYVKSVLEKRDKILKV